MISNLQLETMLLIKIAGNSGWENFQGISFEICSMESHMINPESDILTRQGHEIMLNSPCILL